MKKVFKLNINILCPYFYFTIYILLEYEIDNHNFMKFYYKYTHCYITYNIKRFISEIVYQYIKNPIIVLCASFLVTAWCFFSFGTWFYFAFLVLEGFVFVMGFCLFLFLRMNLKLAW